MNTYIKERRDEGFTLIELLIAIVVVGILTAVVIVGIGGLTNNGSNSACAASRDAAKAASAVHKANVNTYPSSFTDFTAAELDTSDVTVAATTIKHGTDWTLHFTSGGGATAPVFDCTTP
jgi:prepilin-type N-terminal cleavage/methylation domain-containing protein